MFLQRGRSQDWMYRCFSVGWKLQTVGVREQKERRLIWSESAARQPQQQVKHFQSRKGASNYRHRSPGLREELKHYTSSASTLEHLIAVQHLCASLKQHGVKFETSLCNFTAGFFFFLLRIKGFIVRLDEVVIFVFQGKRRDFFCFCIFSPAVYSQEQRYQNRKKINRF